MYPLQCQQKSVLVGQSCMCVHYKQLYYADHYNTDLVAKLRWIQGGGHVSV